MYLEPIENTKIKDETERSFKYLVRKFSKKHRYTSFPHKKIMRFYDDSISIHTISKWITESIDGDIAIVESEIESFRHYSKSIGFYTYNEVVYNSGSFLEKPISAVIVKQYTYNLHKYENFDEKLRDYFMRMNFELHKDFDFHEMVPYIFLIN